jgi:acetyltransferase-like isoleucine patch superfamily enzyme
MVEVLRWIYNKYMFTTAKIRARLYALVCEHIGENVELLKGVRILCPAKVRIGSNTGINISTILDGNGGLSIGSDVMIGPYCQLITANHGFRSRDVPMKEQRIETKPVVIEDDVWLGSSVIVLPGVTVGRGAIVAAGAVVTHDVDAFHIVAGVPARTISIRPA